MADPWARFFFSDFLAGTSGLTAAERGVYMTLLCLFYENDGPIRRDDGRLARRCGMTKAAFIKAITCLIEEGKITETGVMTSNARAEKEIKARAIRSINATASANQRWDAQREKEQQNQPPPGANASAKQCETDANQNQNHTQKR